MESRFALDKGNAMLLGVCAGLARYAGIDVFAVRILTVALTLLLLGPVALILYIVAALVADKG